MGTLKDEALTKREDDINKYYNAWIKDLSEIPSVEQIVKDLEAALKIQKDFRAQALEMIQIAEIEDPEEQYAAVKESMMKKVDLKKDPEAEDRIDAMIKQMREISSNFESKIKDIAKFIEEDIKDVEVVEKEEPKQQVVDGVKGRLIDNLADMVYSSTDDIVG